MITVTPRSLMRRNVPSISATSCGLRPASTSSARSSSGFAASARASSRRFFSATFSFPAGSSAFCASPREESISSATVVAARSDRFSRPKHAPTVTFARQLRSLSGRTTWCARATPRRATWNGRSPVMSSPLNVMRPARGR